MANVGSGAALFEATDQHCNIGALAATVGVQFVENQEAQPLHRLADQLLVVRAHQHQLCHDIVGQQNVGWVTAEFLSQFFAGFTGITGKADREFTSVLHAILIGKTAQSLLLRVDQCVHRIDDQCLHAAARFGLAQQIINNGQKVAGAFAGTGAASHHKTLAASSAFNRLVLVLIETKRCIRGCTKEVSSFRSDHPGPRQIIDGLRHLVSWAELNKRLWPEFLPGKFLLNRSPNPIISNADKRLDKCPIVVNDCCVESEDRWMMHDFLR